MTFDAAQTAGCAQGYFYMQNYFGFWIQVKFMQLLNKQ